MKGSDHVQIVTDTLVYFYKFEEENEVSPTWIPKLESTMNNFMGCISLIVDNKDKICVTYKSGQPNFSTYKRKYDHGFREIIDPTSREGCRGINVSKKHFFIISDDDYIQVHDEETYKMINKIDLPLSKSNTDDAIEILNIEISPDEELLAVLSGKNLIKGIEELH